MGFVYANTDSGPSANSIGWFDFGSDFTIIPGQTANGLTGTLNNGITVSFDLTLNSLGDQSIIFNAVTAPTSEHSYFGSVGYTGLSGNVVLYSSSDTANNLSDLVFSNIMVKDELGNPIQNYMVVLADGDNTSGEGLLEEGLSFTTNGEDWIQLAALGDTNPPTIVGGGSFVGFAGISTPPNTAYVYSTQSPTQVVASLEEAFVPAFQGVAIGFAVTQVQLSNDLTDELNSDEQFYISTADNIDELFEEFTYSNEIDEASETFPSTDDTDEFTETFTSTDDTAEFTETFTSADDTDEFTETFTSTDDTAEFTETFTPELEDRIQNTNQCLNFADLVVSKTANKSISYVCDTITYTIIIKNNGNTPADNVVIKDQTSSCTSYVSCSLMASVPFTGNPESEIQLTNSISAGETVALSFAILVTGSPILNPLTNTAIVNYKYTSNSDCVTATTASTSGGTTIFQNNYSQEINDLIESVALQEAALANIQDAEGAKIQRFVSMPDVTPGMLLCVNKSVQDMTDAMTTLESILKQKLNSVSCQINGRC